MTARYDEADAATGLMAVLHETGHALYNAGLPKEWRYQPVGKPRSFALHESQSLLVEMQICRSRPFLAYLAPLLAESFGVGGAAFTADNLYRQAIRVQRGLIRVDADEVTYPLHIVLRYRLEKALLAGELEVADLPAAWNEGMRELLGVVPPDDRLGVLQDIHWPAGAIGYFPCYTLGAILAAQLYEAMIAAEPDLPAQHRRGRFPAAARLAARQRPRAGRPLRDAGADRARHRPPARAAAVPAPPRDALSCREWRALIEFLVARRERLELNSRSVALERIKVGAQKSALLCRGLATASGRRSASISISRSRVARSKRCSAPFRKPFPFTSKASRGSAAGRTTRSASPSGAVSCQVQDSWSMHCADCFRTVTATDNGTSSPCLSAA